jgi:hypothetical protein
VVDLDHSRKVFFEESKFDSKNQKYGLFSYPGTLAVSSRPYFTSTKSRKNADGLVETAPRNFLTNNSKRGKTPDVFFSHPEYKPEKYTSQKHTFKSDKERADAMKKKHDEIWKPSGTVKEEMSLFEHQASEVFVKINRRDKDGAVMTDPRNFYTSPAKKGANTPGVLLGGYPEHMPEPYERKEKAKGPKIKIASHDAPFKNMDKGGATFNKDESVYGGDNIKARPPKRSVSVNAVKHDLPFKSTSVSRDYIGRYPEHMPNPQPVLKRKTPSEQEPWRASTKHRTSPSPTVTGQIKNLRQEFPALRRLI